MKGLVNIDRLRPGLRAITARSDLALAALLVMTIFMLILPLPTVLVDALVALSLGSAMVLLAVGIYIGSPVAFSAFPSALLIATLFRLALSITTTRLILLQGDAGEVVQTFGDFVVAGNLVVGLVIFLIVTVVQFVVITKGAERIAEVSARFSLDALPGKQMSIDGDMRSGLIGMAQAARRRARLEEESQLYGSMDGAMKFVKGDAIAGLIIIAVNSIGGISIGVLDGGLSFGEALSRYTVLTVGDGLVAQIPALLIAIAAGVIVTRVNSDKGSSLGADIGAQVFAQPQALMLSGALIAAFALVPGFPALVFLVLGATLGGAGFVVARLARQRAEGGGSEKTASESGGLAVLEGADDDSLLAPPVQLTLHDTVRATLSPAAVKLTLDRTRDVFYARFGIPFPGLRVRYTAAGTPNRYSIAVHEVPVANGELKRGHILVRANSADLERLNIEHSVDPDSALGADCQWVDRRHVETLRSHGVDTLDVEQAVGFHLMVVLERYAGDLVGIQETRELLDRMESQYPELIKEAQSLVTVQRLSEVLRRLATEGVPIRNLRGILETLVEWAPKETDAERLTDYVRLGLRRQISHHYSRGQGVVNAITLALEVENVLRESLQTTATTTKLALAPEFGQKLFESLGRAYTNARQHAGAPVLVTPLDLRRPLRGLIVRDFRALPVLARQEIVREVTVRSIEQLELVPGAPA